MPLTRPKLRQIQTAVTKFDDPIIEINSALTGTNTGDIGIVMNRGTSGDNVGIFWDKSAQCFAMVQTTADGDASGDLTFSALADLQVKSLSTENFVLPSVDGTANQVLTTDGIGGVTWQTTNYVLTAKSFGAVNDGVTDNATAFGLIETALNATEGLSVVLEDGGTYLTTSTITVNKNKWFATNNTTIKFSGLSASTDCVILQGSKVTAKASWQNINIDCNGTGRDGLVLAGGKPTHGGADFYDLNGFEILDSVRDGLHLEPAAAYYWIENPRASNVRVTDSGRHGIAMICPDLLSTFINKGQWDNVEVRGSGQTTTGYDIYVEGQGTVGTRKISEHLWNNVELDAHGAASHGTHAMYVNETGTVTLVDGWVFLNPTFEDVGATLTLSEAIGMSTNADVRGIVVLGGVTADYSAVVDKSKIGNTGLVLVPGQNNSFMRFDADGGLEWGDNIGSDTNLYRVQAGVLRTEGMMFADDGYRELRSVATISSGVVTLGAGYTQVNLSENITTVNFPTGVDGQQIKVSFYQNTATPRTVTGWTGGRVAGGAYTATATRWKLDTISFEYNAGVGSWLETSRALNV